MTERQEDVGEKPVTGRVFARCSVQQGAAEIDYYCECAREAGTRGLELLRQYLRRPLALSLGGLFITVILWGTAYKLSQYHPRRNVGTPITAAKMWMTPRDKVFLVGAHYKTKVRPAPDVQPLHAPSTHPRACPQDPRYAPDLTFLDSQLQFSLGTPRSPPLHIL